MVPQSFEQRADSTASGVIAAAIVMAVGYVNPAQGQVSSTTLVVELANVVEYQMDVSDLSKWGTNPNVTQASSPWGWASDASGFRWSHMEISSP
jgi:hypothetical protein